MAGVDSDRSRELAGLDLLESKIGYRFAEPVLLLQALTHRSLSHERGDILHYERLEFLGDSVLGLVVTDQLFQRYPEEAEGELSRRKGTIVSASRLGAFAAELDVGPHLRLGVGEERSGGRSKLSILADVVEAIIGAMYLDSGLDLEPIRRLVEPLLVEDAAARTFVDSKSRLQEVSQASGLGLPEYRLVQASGADHQKTFVIECRLGNGLRAEGEGASKKEASQKAASILLENLDSDPRSVERLPEGGDSPPE